MKKNTFYLLLVILLSACAYYLFTKKHQSDFNKEESNFTVNNIKQVDKILLADMKKNKTILTKKDNQWFANETYHVRQDILELLLNALEKQQAYQPVPISMHDVIIKSLSANATKVQIYQTGELTHSYYVAQAAGANNETYMLQEGAKRPYIVKIPLSNYFLGVRYPAKLDEWRDKKILYEPTQNIQSIAVDYTDSPLHSFTILQNKNTYQLQTPATYTDTLNTTRVKNYLGFYQSLYCIGYENGGIMKDSILRTGKKLASVTITNVQNKKNTLQIYFRPLNQRSKSELHIQGKAYDPDSFYGLYNETDFILISRNNIEKILRSAAEFYQASAPSTAIKP